MKKKKLLFLMVVLMLFWCFPMCIPSFATQKELDEVKETIKELEEERDDAQQQLQELEGEKNYLDGRLQEINSSLSELAGELTSLQIQIEKKEKDILENQQELDQAKQAEGIQYEKMKTRMRFLYEKGEISFAEVLVNARSFSDFINIAEYVESIYQYDRERLEQYRMVKEDIVLREVQLQEDHAQLLVILDEKEYKQQEVKVLLEEILELAKNADEQIESTEEELASYEAELEEKRTYEQELEEKSSKEETQLDPQLDSRLKKRLEEIRRQEEEISGDLIISNSEEDIAVLAAIIECEAGGEGYEGKLGVGSVVLNRVRSSYYPNSIIEVLYSPGQFTPVTTGKFAEVLSRGASADCVKAAKENLSGVITVNSLYFRRYKGQTYGHPVGNILFY